MYDNPIPPCRCYLTLPGAGPYNDLGSLSTPPITSDSAGKIANLWFSGLANRLIVTPAVGGSAINSLGADNLQDGARIQVRTGSSTDNLTFNHLGGGKTANQFSNMYGGVVTVPPLGAAWMHREFFSNLGYSLWQFA